MNAKSGHNRELNLVMGLAALLTLPFVAKPWHMDEPLFLAVARHILSDPAHPLAFAFNWYGKLAPMATINNTPPLFLYLLALALKLTGGSEWGMRLFFLPVPLLTAAGFYRLAARYLQDPLYPALIAVAAPATALTWGLLYPENLSLLFGVWGLIWLVQGLDESRSGLFWLSAAFLDLAILSKYAAVVFLLPAAGYILESGVGIRRAAAHLLVCLALPLVLALRDYLGGHGAMEAAAAVTLEAAASPWAYWPIRLRSVLCFLGGCGVATGFWPLFMKGLRPPPLAAALSAATVFFLFWSGFDVLTTTTLDRISGALWALGGLWCLLAVLSPSRAPAASWRLFAPWVLAVVILELCFYWSVIARIIAFATPAAVFALASILEKSAPDRPQRLRALYRSTLAATLLITLSSGYVDYRYASSARDIVRLVAMRWLKPGHRLWVSGHWGLQYYAEEEGGAVLDYKAPPEAQPRRGDVIIMPWINSWSAQTAERFLISRLRLRAHVFMARSGIPVRLLSGWEGQAGFYSNSFGFLPYTLSREPIERYVVAKVD